MEWEILSRQATVKVEESSHTSLYFMTQHEKIDLNNTTGGAFILIVNRKPILLDQRPDDLELIFSPLKALPYKETVCNTLLKYIEFAWFILYIGTPNESKLDEDKETIFKGIFVCLYCQA